MDSTEMIALWHEKKDILKEKDFRGDPWRLAREAFFMGMACGFGYCKGQYVDIGRASVIEGEYGNEVFFDDFKKILGNTFTVGDRLEIKAIKHIPLKVEE